MATAFVKEDLSCYICLNPCTDPLTLQCGHKFCWVCIVHELDTQEESSGYCCPKCGEKFHERPPMLHKKSRLSTAERVFCTYCDGPILAIKTCLHCSASLCAKHLRRHSKEPEHILVEPTASPEDRKCPVHRQVLTHYCMEHDVFICLLCYVVGDHSNHEVLLVNIDSSEKRKKHLRRFIKNLGKEKQKIEAQIHSLQDLEEAQVVKTNACSEGVIDQVRNVQVELNALQDKVLSEVCTQRKSALTSIFDWKKKLEDQVQELSRKVNDVQELGNIKDPWTFFKKLLGTDLIGIFNGEHRNVSGKMFDVTPISEMLHKEILKFADGLINRMLKDAFPKMKKSEITLDLKTANCNIIMRKNLSVAYYSVKRQPRDIGPERFRSHHVLSKRSFSSGNHYWEVAVKGAQCSIGVAYNNIERKTKRYDSRIGYNDKSWALNVDDVNFIVRHNNVRTKIPADSHVRSFGIFLEYEAGRLSLYQLCDPIRYLHTFTATFIRPLHASFYLGEGSRIEILN